MRFAGIASVGCAVALVGCVSFAPPPLVREAEGAEPISGLRLSCGNEEAFTRDCSALWGPELLLSVGELEPLVAGTEDGRTFLLFGASSTANQSASERANDSNAAYVALRAELADAGIRIERARPVMSAGLLIGYVVYSDGAAYDVIQRLAATDDSD